MNSNKRLILVSVFFAVFLIIEGLIVNDYFNNNKVNSIRSASVDLNELTYNNVDLKIYSKDDFDTFIDDYNSGRLPDIYITEFIFDGVGMYKTYDLDDFIDEGNDVSVKVFSGSVLNINTTGNISLSGDFKGTVLVNTNNIDNDINLILDNVNIDSDSKKVPAIYVYNKDISYTDHKVTIVPKENTVNFITGGKFKKVSLIGSDELNNYSSKYVGDASSWYSSYTNYYGVYSSSDIDKILFAKVTASSEDLADGDPYYFYKGAGAISSDIDLYFSGSGSLNVTSIGKEGIETKGNLVFSGGVGDYVVNAQDDCLNTTTKSGDGVRNEMVIDVNSLIAVVYLDADEGDAIDSNGTLTINGGRIIAISHPGADSGLDSDNGTYINGGEILATGDMYDEIKSDSKQRFMVLSFYEKNNDGDLITLLDSSDNALFSFSTDRSYTNLVYSSSSLVDGTYSFYKNGEITGNNLNGFYYKVDSYNKGVQLGYTGNSIMGPGQGFDRPNDFSENEQVPQMLYDSNNQPPEKPSDFNDNNQPPEKPGDGVEPPKKSSDGMEPPEKPSDEMNPNLENGNIVDGNPYIGFESSNKNFTINGISNLFGGVMIYSVE